MAILEIPIIAADWQDFYVVLNGHSCLFTVKYSRLINRWSFDLTVDGVPRVQGRRLVPENDLIANFNLDVGEIRLIEWEVRDRGEPGHVELPRGDYRLVCIT